MKPDDTRHFHDTHAKEYLAWAYGEAPGGMYATGTQRTRVMALAVAPFAGRSSHVVDLGCGRGDLCFALATLGARVVGVDFSGAMLAEAAAACRLLPPPVAERVTLSEREILANGLDAESFDAVTASGVIETEDDDERLFGEAARLLRPGGAFAVSCRNRLFNLVSLNRHTREELTTGSANALLAEAETILADPPARQGFRTSAEAFVRRLGEQTGALAATLGPNAASATAAPGFSVGRTRQHTPSEISASAAAAGFGDATFFGVHPHPLPPALEALAPEFYNRLASVYEAFETHPVSLIWSSSFVALFVKQRSSTA